jgi:hypothetical protein
MHNPVLAVFRNILMPSLIAEYIERKYPSQVFYDKLSYDVLIEKRKERKNLLQFVDKKLYGKLEMKVLWPHSTDRVVIENSECESKYLYTSLQIQFDFRKEVPLLNYKYKDTELTMTLPDSFELET